MPTRRGRVVLGAAVLLYVLARAGSVGELYALAAAAAVFPLAAVASVRWRRHALRFERTLRPARVFAGHDVRVSLVVRNDGTRTGPPLLLEDDAPAGLGGPIRVSAPPLERRGTQVFAGERRAVARGRYTVGPLRARAADPFGLAEVATDVAPATHLLVYPRVEALTEDGPPEARGGGGRSPIHRLAAAGDDFYGVREWQEGDDLRKIHWRTTARRDELMIRQDEVRPFPRATILLDTRASEHRDAGPGSSIEWSVTAAASIAWELARQGFALRLGTTDVAPGTARWGREAVDPVLGALAVAGRSGARTLTPALRRATGRGAGGALVAILVPPTPDCLPMLLRLRRDYSFRGAILLDTVSFRRPSPRERALADQRMADADRMLARAGWRVVVAGATDRIRPIWQSLLVAGAHRPSSPSLRS